MKYLIALVIVAIAVTLLPTSGRAASVAFVVSDGGLNCRAWADLAADVIEVIPDGTAVALRGWDEGDWAAVSCPSGADGYAWADYLGRDDAGAGSGSYEGGAGTLYTTDSVNLRTAAWGSVIRVLGSGEAVEATGGADGEFVEVVADGDLGYVHRDYLSGSGDGSSPSTSSGDGWAGVTTDDVNFRDAPWGSVIWVLAAGTELSVLGDPEDGFYPVEVSGNTGYVHADYVTGDDNGVVTNPDAGSAMGVVDYALGYVGYPYVWGTHGPDSFDCSGFVYWVYANAAGVDLGTGSEDQYVTAGSWVDGDLASGDLLFYDTDGSGSAGHVGIYVGDGLMVHAANESTGVIVSDINGSYYASRFLGARRVL